MQVGSSLADGGVLSLQCGVKIAGHVKSLPDGSIPPLIQAPQIISGHDKSDHQDPAKRNLTLVADFGNCSRCYISQDSF